VQGDLPHVAGAGSFIEGTDVGRIGPDGRFEEIVGFLDKVPAALLSWRAPEDGGRSLTERFPTPLSTCSGPRPLPMLGAASGCSG
jgi:hypothetical protein